MHSILRVIWVLTGLGLLSSGLSSVSLGNESRVAAAVVPSDPGWALGPKRVLWIMVDYAEDPGAPCADVDVSQACELADRYFTASSRARTSYSVTLFPVVLRTSQRRLDAAMALSSGDHEAIAPDILAQARAYDSLHGGTGLHDPDRYDRWVINCKALPSSSCVGRAGGNGAWVVGAPNAAAVIGVLRDNLGLGYTDAIPLRTQSGHDVYTHELGEGGMDLSDWLGIPTPWQGNGMPWHMFTGHKADLGYLDAGEVHQVTGSAVFRLRRCDVPAASGTLALVIPTPEGGEYWIECRRNPGLVTSAAFPGAYDHYMRGVLLHWRSPRDAQSLRMDSVLDFGCGNAFDASDPFLPVGQTYADPRHGLRITPLASGGSGDAQYVDVLVSLFPDHSSPAAPSLAIEPGARAVPAGRAVVFSARGEAQDGGEVHCVWDFGDGSPRQVGGEVSHAWVAGGTYQVTCRAISVGGGETSRAITIEVVQPWSDSAAIVEPSGVFVATGAMSVANGRLFVCQVLNNPAPLNFADYSTVDGKTWEVMPNLLSSGEAFRLGKVLYTNGRYLARASISGRYWGEDTAILSSPDATVWTVVYRTSTLDPVLFLDCLVQGPGGFVAVDSNGTTLWSQDGAAWSPVALPPGLEFWKVSSGGGRYLAVDTRRRALWASADGRTWTEAMPASLPILTRDASYEGAGTFLGLGFASGHWFAVSEHAVFRADEGLAWVPVASSLSTGVEKFTGFHVTREGVLILMAQGSERMLVSADGVSWAPLALPPWYRQLLDEAGAGPYRVMDFNGGLLVDTPAGSPSRNLLVLGSLNGVASGQGLDSSGLVNVSVRALSKGTEAPVIVGLVVRGEKPLLFRAWGPALANYGIGGCLQDPVLRLHDDIGNGGGVLAQNDNWGSGDVSGLRTLFRTTGAVDFPDATSRDSVVAMEVSGTRSLYVSDAGGGSGVTLLEIYDADSQAPGRIVNFSARAQVGTGDSIIVMGFSIQGAVAKRVLLRGLGSELSAPPFNLPDMVSSPEFSVHRVVGGVPILVSRTEGDDDPGLVTVVGRAVGAYAYAGVLAGASSRVLTLPPGLYTVELRNASGAPGQAMIELYEVD